MNILKVGFWLPVGVITHLYNPKSNLSNGLPCRATKYKMNRNKFTCFHIQSCCIYFISSLDSLRTISALYDRAKFPRKYQCIQSLGYIPTKHSVQQTENPRGDAPFRQLGNRCSNMFYTKITSLNWYLSIYLSIIIIIIIIIIIGGVGLSP
jgi:hypothetical protein